MSCSQLVDIEELVLGDLGAERAAELRVHARECAACRRELALVTAERALFTRRAQVVPGPPPALATAVRESLVAEAEREAERGVPRRAGRLVAGMGRLLRRGHVTAACAAALFCVAGFSRLGEGAGMYGATDSAVRITTERDWSGGRVSTLSCGAGMDPRDLHDGEDPSDAPVCAAPERGERRSSPSGAIVADVLEVSGPAPAPRLGSLASLAPEITCGAAPSEECKAASCEPSVTCSSLRQ